MLDGNEPSRGKLIPQCPRGAESIGTFGMIQYDSGRLRKWVLCAGTSHRGRAYHDAPPRLKPLCKERSERVEMVDELTQPTGASAIGEEG